jgi:hypothetical protein
LGGGKLGCLGGLPILGADGVQGDGEQGSCGQRRAEGEFASATLFRAGEAVIAKGV